QLAPDVSLARLTDAVAVAFRFPGRAEEEPRLERQCVSETLTARLAGARPVPGRRRGGATPGPAVRLRDAHRQAGGRPPGRGTMGERADRHPAPDGRPARRHARTAGQP